MLSFGLGRIFVVPTRYYRTDGLSRLPLRPHFFPVGLRFHVIAAAFRHICIFAVLSEQDQVERVQKLQTTAIRLFGHKAIRVICSPDDLRRLFLRLGFDIP